MSNASERIAQRLMELIPLLTAEVRGAMEADRGGLTLAQYRILAHVRSGTRNVSTLAARQGISQAAMSKIVNGMVRKRLLRRAANAADARQSLLEPTAAGMAAFRRMQLQLRRRLSDRVSPLGAASQARVLRSLAALIRAFPPRSGRETR